MIYLVINNVTLAQVQIANKMININLESKQTFIFIQ